MGCATMKPLTIAIDFDHTWSADPNLFGIFAYNATKKGHTVIIATARDADHDNNDLNRVVPERIPRVFSNGGFKREACRRAGYTVNIWIDDTPAMVDPIMFVGDNTINDDEL